MVTAEDKQWFFKNIEKSFYFYYKLDWKKEDVFFNDKDPLLFVDYLPSSDSEKVY